jgi:hypothetical protein
LRGARRARNVRVVSRDLDAERAYVRNWLETGRLLDDLRWKELASLDPAQALQASRDLIAAALLVPLPASRQHWSGLVELQALLHHRQPR